MNISPCLYWNAPTGYVGVFKEPTTNAMNYDIYSPEEKHVTYHRENYRYKISLEDFNLNNDLTATKYVKFESCMLGKEPNYYDWTTSNTCLCNTTTSASAWNTYGYVAFQAPPVPPSERMREIIQSRQAPAIHVRRHPLEQKMDVRELRARETLRRLIGEEKYRNFLCCGFLTVRGISGLTYQIFPGYNTAKSYRAGKLVESLCIRLYGGFTPTDELIMRYLMILNDEEKFRKIANISRLERYVREDRMALPVVDRNLQTESLPAVFRRLKEMAA